MIQNTDKLGLMEKEALTGEIQDGEMTEVLKESSARRRWVALCWLLTCSGEKVRFSSVQRDNSLNLELDLQFRFGSSLNLVQTF